MSKSKNLFWTLVLSIPCFFLFSCNQSQKEQKTSKKGVDIILKAQSVSFDEEKKEQIISEYEQLKTLEVPHNLVGQNKWLMFEGPVIENDIIAYRFYADSRHRFDIYGKTVTDLVMDTVSWNYHDIMNWGSDILKVGKSLGIGSPAIYVNDTLLTLSEWEKKSLEIIQEDENVAILKTTFKGLVIENKKVDLVQNWSMEKGSPWSSIDINIVKGELPEGARFATGFVKHLDTVAVTETPEGTLAYNFGIQSYHDQLLGMAIFIPKTFQAKPILDKYSHVLVGSHDRSSTSFRYKFMANWSEGIEGVKSVEEFVSYVDETLNGE